MRLSFRAVLSLLAIALPLGVSAMAVGVNLGDMIGTVQTNKKPLAFDINVKGTYGNDSGTISIKGTQNGNLRSLEKAALDATILLDAKESTTSWGHAEFKTRLVNQTLYVRLEDFSAEGEWAAYINYVKPYEDVWYSFPLEKEEYEEFMEEMKESRNASYKEIEGFFKIVQEELRNGKTRMTLTIPKNRQRRLISRLLGTDYARYYRNTSIDATLSVDSLQNVFDALTGSLDFKATDSYSQKKMTLKITASATTLKTAPKFLAPEESVDFEEFVREQEEKEQREWEENRYNTEDGRNAQRRSDVNTILNAVYQYAIDHNGNLPPKITTTPKEICRTNMECDGISLDILTGSYLVRIPQDPSITEDSEDTSTHYVISKDSKGRVTVAAPLAEKGVVISITK